MKILVCTDSFKGTMSAPVATAAVAKGLRKRYPEAEIIEMPVGDGGEGTVEALAASLPDAERVCCDTFDALRRPITASYVVAGGKTALIESAAAAGLTLIPPEERDIMHADTFGVGEMIAHAYRRGIRDFVVGMGGTATCDGGAGALESLDRNGVEGVNLTLLCDVDNPLAGENGAAAVFGPQKGATPEQIPLLDRRLRELSDRYRLFHGVDTTDMNFAGAAGGLAAMLMARYRATPVYGIGKVLQILNFDSLLDGADLVVTGEGKADDTTLRGKAAKGILDAARRRGVPAVLIAGKIANFERLAEAGFLYLVQATPDHAGQGASYPELLADASYALINDSEYPKLRIKV